MAGSVHLSGNKLQPAVLVQIRDGISPGVIRFLKLPNAIVCGKDVQLLFQIRFSADAVSAGCGTSGSGESVGSAFSAQAESRAAMSSAQIGIRSFINEIPFSSLFRKLLLVPVDLLLIAVLLGKDAAAVLLHIESQLPGPLVSCPEVGPEVPVEKLHAVLLGILLRRSLDALVVLI